MTLIKFALSLLTTAVSVVLTFLILAAPAQAQATRTWVSGVGDDVNPCSRTAPCKTFAGAISKTAAGGEINCLDPGGFGTLTITKSITIDCTGTFGSTLNSGGINGFVINDSATATPKTVDVILRGLSIDGAGSTPGLNGIRFISGRSLVVEDVFIQNQTSGNSVSIAPGGNARIFLNNVTMTDGGGGILIDPTAAVGVTNVVLQNVRIQNHTGTSLRIDTTAPSNTVAVIADNVQLTSSANGLVINAPAGGGLTGVVVTDSIIEQNSGVGISAVGTRANARVSSTSITGNGTGVSTTGGLIGSYGDNLLDSNGVNGTFSGAPLPKK